MAINLIEWLKTKFFGGGRMSAEDCRELSEALADIHIRELAFNSAVNLIARAVSKCEFRVYDRGRSSKDAEYYLWNVQPNVNQSSSAFIHKWIYTLFRHNECLIIGVDGQLLVADSYQVQEDPLKGDHYTAVQVGDYIFDGAFMQDEVLFYKLNNRDMRKIADGMYQSYQKLLGYAMKSYQKSRGTKGVYNYGAMPQAGTKEREAFDTLINNRMKTWLESDSGALPIGRGQTWTELKQVSYSNDTTRDIRAMIDDISDFYAKAFGIPPPLLRGDVSGTSDAVDMLLTFGVDPLVDFLAEEINRKRVREAEYLRGTRVEIYTGTIKHVDILSSATAIDKLVSSGVMSVNGILTLLGEPTIPEPWADQHFITKNYSSLSEALAALGEGRTE